MRRSDVPHPPDSIAPINSLPVLCGYQCHTSGCGFVSTSKDNTRKHCCKVHNWSTRPRGQKQKQTQQGQALSLQASCLQPYSKVAVQIFWTEKKYINYFVIQETTQSLAASHSDPCRDAWSDIEVQYQAAQDQQAKQQTIVLQATEHISKLTLWLKGTRYASYLEGLLLDKILQAY